jgi:hypothetical protein
MMFDSTHDSPVGQITPVAAKLTPVIDAAKRRHVAQSK